MKKFLSVYFYSVKSTIRSLAGIIAALSFLSVVVLWLVAMTYAFFHNGHFADMSESIMFYFFFCPLMSLVIGVSVYYPLNDQLEKENTDNPNRR